MRRAMTVLLAMLVSACGGGGPGDYKHIFVTSAGYGGNLGGLAGADAKCATHAAAAGLSGTYIAWLSDLSSNAIDRIANVGPWYLVDGKTKAFNNKANLATAPLVPINMNENEQVYENNVWTGTTPGGTASALHCGGWTSSSTQDAGTDGNSAANDSAWTVWHTGFYGGIACSTHASLYCIEH